MGVRDNRGVAAAALSWALTIAAAPAWAQTTTPSEPVATPDAASDTDQIPGDIVVTAQRRSQSLQDVPVTVTVFGAAEIEQARIQTVQDVVTRTPGLSFDVFPPSQPRLAVRGIGSSDKGAAGDPSSAVFLDEVYLGRPAAVAFDAFDLERIEVLKGPQGTLFGRNVVGGAINVITKRPDPSRVDAAAEFTYGNFDRLDAAAFVNVPIGDRGAIRVSGAYRSHDGYAYNPRLDARIDDEDRLSGRFQFLAEPTDTLRVHFTLDATRDRASGPAQHVFDLDPSDPLSAAYTVDRDPNRTYGDQVGFQDRDTVGVRGEVSWDSPFATVTFLGSFRDLDYRNGYDFDGNVAPENLVNISGGEAEQSEMSSQELRFSSLQGSRINWVVGVFHYFQDVARQDVFTLDTPFVAPIPLTEIYDQNAQLDSVAVFGDATVPLTDKFELVGGVRYSRDRKTYHIRNTRSDVPLRGDEFFDVTPEKTWDDVTWRGGVNFKPSRDHLLYGLVSRGFKSGGFQDTPSSAADAMTPFDPETAIQYEIGQKSRFFDGRLIWNNTLYWLDYKNLQTRQAQADGSIITNNAGKATIKGFETQLTARPFGGFVLSGAYAYTDARFDVFDDNGVDRSGNRISRTPRHKVTVSPSYTTAVGGMEATVALDYRYESLIYDDNSNLPPEIRPATNFVDARLVLEKIADRVSVSVWGKNLTDERTRIFQSVFLGANFGTYNPPRTYGVTLGVRY
jgi:iron complex outermembrane receptor protein